MLKSVEKRETPVDKQAEAEEKERSVELSYRVEDAIARILSRHKGSYALVRAREVMDILRVKPLHINYVRILFKNIPETVEVNGKVWVFLGVRPKRSKNTKRNKYRLFYVRVKEKNLSPS